MRQHSEQETLADILNAYVASTSDPSHASLTGWIRLYPQYERELTEFSISWSLMESLPASSKSVDVDEDTLVLRGMSIVQNILHEQKQAEQSRDQEAPLESIFQEGTVHGLSIRQVAERAQLSIALVRKLDRRLIAFTSIPAQAIESLARAIHREFPVVAHYLQGEPTLPQGARYHSEQAPRVAGQEDFFVAVRNDRTLSQERRHYWLAFASSDA